MSICTELSNAIYACEQAYDADMYKADAIMKIAQMQRQCAINDFELKAMTEAADDELSAIMESGNEKFVQKAKQAASKAIEAIKSFFENLINKVKSLHASISEKIGKLNTKNPFVSRRKVKGPNKNTIKNAEKEYDKLQKDLNKLALRAAAGDDIRFEDVSECYEAFIRRMDAVASEEQYTISECAAIARQAANEANKTLTKIQESATSGMDEVSKRAEKIDSPDKASIFAQIINTLSRAAQKAGSTVAAFPGKVTGAIGKGVDKNATREEPVEESAKEPSDESAEEKQEEVATESAVDDLEKIFSLDLDELLGTT